VVVCDPMRPLANLDSALLFCINSSLGLHYFTPAHICSCPQVQVCCGPVLSINPGGAVIEHLGSGLLLDAPPIFVSDLTYQLGLRADTLGSSPLSEPIDKISRKSNHLWHGSLSLLFHLSCHGMRKVSHGIRCSQGLFLYDRLTWRRI